MIKKYQEFIKESKEDIDNICRKYNIYDYTINDDESIDVVGDVYLSGENLDKYWIGKSLPLKFRNVSGNFNCSYNELTSLEGSPVSVGGWFNCPNNKLNSFKGCPTSVGGDFLCFKNNIRDFYGFPDFWEGRLYLDYNPLFEIYNLFECNNRCTELLNTTRTIIGDKIRVEGILDVADAMNIKLPENWKEQIKNYKLIQ